MLLVFLHQSFAAPKVQYTSTKTTKAWIKETPEHLSSCFLSFRRRCGLTLTQEDISYSLIFDADDVFGTPPFILESFEGACFSNLMGRWKLIFFRNTTLLGIGAKEVWHEPLSTPGQKQNVKTLGDIHHLALRTQWTKQESSKKSFFSFYPQRT